MVMVLNWSTLTGRKREGDIEVWGHANVGIPHLLLQEASYPKPNSYILWLTFKIGDIAGAQTFRITRKQPFGATWPTNQDGSTIVTISDDRLRNIAGEYARDEGYDPK